MTYGARFYNNSNNYVTIDEEAVSYVYLSKYSVENGRGGGHYDITVNCVGYPLIFFDVPYNVGPGDGRTDGQAYQDRFGIQITKISPGSSSNTWVVSFLVNCPNYYNLVLNMRVFGMLHLNFPSGSSDRYGVRIWNSQSQIVFDSGCKQLRLAGDTSGVEMALDWRWPTLRQQANNAYDAVTSVPFDMANKSICANARGIIYVYDQTGSFQDVDNQIVYEFNIMHFNTLYYASGSTLYARRVATDVTQAQSSNVPSADTSRCQVVYTRLAVIDNTLYP